MPKITLFDENRQNYVEIERVAYESYDLSHSLTIRVVQDSFRGAVGVWTDDLVLRNFVKQLGKCEETRRGEAELHAMSPREFSLRIFNTHDKGDFALEYEICQFNPASLRLEGGFAIDPSLLPQILREFEDFLTL